jgi:hypothetical protein
MITAVFKSSPFSGSQHTVALANDQITDETLALPGRLLWAP